VIGGPTEAQRRVLVRLLSLAALSLPISGALGALPGVAEWQLSERLLWAGNVSAGVSAVLLVVALVVALGGPSLGATVLRGDVRWLVVGASAIASIATGWLALSLLFDVGWFGVGWVDSPAIAVAGRRTTGVAVGAAAAITGAAAMWTAVDSEGGARRG